MVDYFIYGGATLVIILLIAALYRVSKLPTVDDTRVVLHDGKYKIQKYFATYGGADWGFIDPMALKSHGFKSEYDNLDDAIKDCDKLYSILHPNSSSSTKCKSVHISKGK